MAQSKNNSQNLSDEESRKLIKECQACEERRYQRTMWALTALLIMAVAKVPLTYFLAKEKRA